MNIIELARQAGGLDMTINGFTTFVGTQTPDFLERFAALVRAEERERCAEICDGVRAVNGSARDCAKDIRGMGDE